MELLNDRSMDRGRSKQPSDNVRSRRNFNDNHLYPTFTVIMIRDTSGDDNASHTTYRVCQNSLQSRSDNGTFVGFYSVSGLATATTTTTPSTVQLCNRMQITLPIVLLIFTSTRYNRSSVRPPPVLAYTV